MLFLVYLSQPHAKDDNLLCSDPEKSFKQEKKKLQ